MRDPAYAAFSALDPFFDIVRQATAGGRTYGARDHAPHEALQGIRLPGSRITALKCKHRPLSGPFLLGD